jgi:hypothetical protein
MKEHFGLALQNSVQAKNAIGYFAVENRAIAEMSQRENHISFLF